MPAKPYLCLHAMLVIVSVSSVCRSQTDPPPGWTASTITRVKPEMRSEYEAYLKQIMMAYRKAKIPWFITLQNVAGDTTEYTTIVPVVKLGDLDGPAVVVRMLGEEGWTSLSRKLDRCYTAQTREFATRQTELEIDQPGVPLEGYWMETRTLVTQGRMDDYLAWLKNDYVPALEKAGVTHFRVSRPIFGGEGGEIVSTRMLKNLAEIDGGPVLTKALGEIGARVAGARLVPLVRSSSTRIMQMRPDLTYALPPMIDCARDPSGANPGQPRR